MQRIDNPTPLFIDARGTLLDGGHVYIGTPNADPQVQPIPLFWDAALSIPAAQPLRTLGGQIVNGTTPALVFAGGSDYSIKITDAFDVQISYVASIASAMTAYQPLDSDLTTIAGQTNTTFGLNLLTLANAAALATATGVPPSLPLAGGIMQGSITRQGYGAFLINGNAGYTGAGVFVRESGDSDPTVNPGDWWVILA